MKNNFFSLIPNAIIYRLPYYFKYELLFQKAKSNDSKFKSILNKRKVFVFLVADYGNLGDVSITFAQIQILKKKFPDYEIVEVLFTKFIEEIKIIKHICQPNDIVTIVGGGNMGDMYYAFEMFREMVIFKFKHNKVISFPQTIDFSDSRKGRRALSIAKKIYSKHPDLTILALEEKSYKLMKEIFPKNRVHLTPDVVMTLDYTNNIQKDRNGVVICMRNDVEKHINNEQYLELITFFEQKYDCVKYYDTHIGRNNLTESEKRNELDKLLQEFSSAQLVITDRLHGMIFSYITGTPAIVFPNKNSKVEKCYNWIADCGYIQFIKDLNIDSIENIVDIACSTKIDKEKFKLKKQYFENLILETL